jgi:hypothetical protein
VLGYWHRQRTCAAYAAKQRAWLQQHVAVVDPAGACLCMPALRAPGKLGLLGMVHAQCLLAHHDGATLLTPPVPAATLRVCATHGATRCHAGDWLVRWQQQFAGLGITHLRSTTAGKRWCV